MILRVISRDMNALAEKINVNGIYGPELHNCGTLLRSDLRGRPDGRWRVLCDLLEESPDSTRQRCRVTPGRGNPRESATENSLLLFAEVRVKRWGKSPPQSWQQLWHGKPHREQCQIGATRGAGGATHTARKAVLARWPGLAARGAMVTSHQEEWSSTG